MDGGKAKKDHSQSVLCVPPHPTPLYSISLSSPLCVSLSSPQSPGIPQPFIQSYRGVVRQAKGSCAVKIDVPYSFIDFAIVVLCVHINNDTQLSLYLAVSGQF